MSDAAFLQRDPDGFVNTLIPTGGPDSLPLSVLNTNQTGYALQDPINFIDPSGKNAVAIGACVVVVAVVYVAGKYVQEVRTQCQEDINKVLNNPKDPNKAPYNGDVNKCTINRLKDPLGLGRAEGTVE